MLISTSLHFHLPITRLNRFNPLVEKERKEWTLVDGISLVLLSVRLVALSDQATTPFPETATDTQTVRHTFEQCTAHCTTSES